MDYKNKDPFNHKHVSYYNTEFTSEVIVKVVNFDKEIKKYCGLVALKGGKALPELGRIEEAAKNSSNCSNLVDISTNKQGVPSWCVPF